jgi:hypothetical protein
MGKRSNSNILEMIFVSIDIVYTLRQFKFSTADPRNHETLARTNEPKKSGSSRFCVISLTYIEAINLCVLCVFVVRSTPPLGGMYLRIHFTHQTQESQNLSSPFLSEL